MPTHLRSDSGAIPLKWLLAAASIGLVIAAIPALFRSPQTSPGGGPATVEQATFPEIARTNLVLLGRRLHQVGHTNPFTGIVLEHFPDGQLRSRSAVSNGLLHGLSEGWHANGQLQVTEHFREGVSHGLRTKWYSIGVKQSEATIVDGKLHGPYRKWHENGTLTEQVDFVADQPEGVSLSYFPSGSLKARVVMKNGKPVQQALWRDGEKKE